MNNRTNQIGKVLISVAVILMFTVALIAGGFTVLATFHAGWSDAKVFAFAFEARDLDLLFHTFIGKAFYRSQIPAKGFTTSKKSHCYHRGR